jgi:hypothetical protein
MTPSLPPLLAGKTLAEAEPSSALRALSGAWHQHRYAIVFAWLFIGKLTVRLVQFSRNPTHRDAAAGLRWMYRRLTRDWFSLIVANAFVAFGTALALHFVQQFSPVQLLWGFVLGLFRPLFDALDRVVPGFGLLDSLVAWYNSNQMKFLFWLVYSAAICDDLGLPNLKTLGRRLWRYWLNRRSSRDGSQPMTVQAAGAQAPAPEQPTIMGEAGWSGNKEFPLTPGLSPSEGAPERMGTPRSK